MCDICGSEGNIKCNICRKKFCQSCFNWNHKIDPPMKYIIKNNRNYRHIIGSNNFSIVQNADIDKLIRKYNNIIRAKGFAFDEYRNNKTSNEFLEIWELIPHQSIKIHLTKLLKLYFFGGFYLNLDLKIVNDFFSIIKDSNKLVFFIQNNLITHKILGVTEVRNFFIKNLIDETILKLKKYIQKNHLILMI